MGSALLLTEKMVGSVWYDEDVLKQWKVLCWMDGSMYSKHGAMESLLGTRSDHENYVLDWAVKKTSSVLR